MHFGNKTSSPSESLFAAIKGKNDVTCPRNKMGTSAGKIIRKDKFKEDNERKKMQDLW